MKFFVSIKVYGRVSEERNASHFRKIKKQQRQS